MIKKDNSEEWKYTVYVCTLVKWLHMKYMYSTFCYPLLFTSGNSNETAELSTEGFTGRVLLIVSAVVQLLVWIVAFAAAAHGILGLYAFI